MQRAGLAEKLARLLRPILRRLFPDFAGDRGTMDTIAANVSANLLGLGNAEMCIRDRPTRGRLTEVTNNQRKTKD